MYVWDDLLVDVAVEGCRRRSRWSVSSLVDFGDPLIVFGWCVLL